MLLAQPVNNMVTKSPQVSNLSFTQIHSPTTHVLFAEPVIQVEPMHFGPPLSGHSTSSGRQSGPSPSTLQAGPSTSHGHDDLHDGNLKSPTAEQVATPPLDPQSIEPSPNPRKRAGNTIQWASKRLQTSQKANEEKRNLFNLLVTRIDMSLPELDWCPQIRLPFNPVSVTPLTSSQTVRY